MSAAMEAAMARRLDAFVVTGAHSIGGGKRPLLGAFTIGALLLIGLGLFRGAVAQQSGGILKIGHFTSPASMSMLEESTIAVNRPMSGVFNNLVMFKQDEPQNTPDTIRSEEHTSEPQSP